VLEAYAMLIDGTSLLDQECKSVLLKLLEVFRAGTSTAEYGFEVLAMFQRLGDATFPYPHFQQTLRITSAEKVAEALSEYFDTEQVHAAVRAYCTALANYADSMAATYRAKFVPLKEALRVAQSMAAIRAAVDVPDDVVVVMVDDKAGAVVGAGARDALVAVRPFMGNDAELDATEERSLEREIREIAERAAPARECKRKREVTAE
jgi:hypothetical protein